MNETKRPPRLSQVAKQRKVDEFNQQFPIGTTVNVRMDSGEIRTTTTRGIAELLGGHTPCVWLEGISGAYLLDRVTPLVRKAER